MGCELDNYPYTNADEMVIIDKAEFSVKGKVIYTVRAHNDTSWKTDWNSDWNTNSTLIRFYSSDRSFDVGDNIKLIEK